MLNSFKIKHFRYYLVLSISLLLYSCNKQSKLEKEILSIPVDIEIVRFDKIFGNSEVDDLQELKSNFPFFFLNNTRILFGN